MKGDLWDKYRGQEHIVSFSENAWRMVEEQDHLATRKLVDSLEEQSVLEDLIESSKPSLKEDFKGYHPLLYTPFRYPTLEHGSRFGTRFEPSLWYGSLQLKTVMAETAYYRFNFLRASKAEFGNVITYHSAFSVGIKTSRGIDLTQFPFAESGHIISSPSSYQGSQILGAAMRQENIEAFFYQSARDPDQRNNLALFTPKAFSQKNPHGKSFQSWRCIVNDKAAEFVRLNAIHVEAQSFMKDIFLLEGKLPFPAE